MSFVLTILIVLSLSAEAAVRRHIAARLVPARPRAGMAVADIAWSDRARVRTPPRVCMLKG